MIGVGGFLCFWENEGMVELKIVMIMVGRVKKIWWVKIGGRVVLFVGGMVGGGVG